MTHPYSIFIWQPPLSSTGEGRWIEPLQAYTQEYALYAANLIHQDTHAVIKVVRYGLNIKCFLDEHTVALVERQIARQRARRENEGSPADLSRLAFLSDQNVHNVSFHVLLDTSLTDYLDCFQECS